MLMTNIWARKSTAALAREAARTDGVDGEPRPLKRSLTALNLVALGMGVSFVPIRALALYGRKRTLQRLPMKERFVRELVVVVRRHGRTPEHLAQFVGNVLV